MLVKGKPGSARDRATTLLKKTLIPDCLGKVCVAATTSAFAQLAADGRGEGGFGFRV